MPGERPRKPSGNSTQANWAQKVHQKAFDGSRLGQVSGHRVMNTNAGPMIIPSGSRRRGGSVSVQQFKLRFAEDDYLVCREWDGETLGTADVYVLKPYKLRCSLESETVWGTGPAFLDYEYTYAPDSSEPYMEYGTTVPESDPPVNEWGESESDYDVGEVLFELRLNVIRTVDADGTLENQRVIPVWLKGDIIYGIEFDGGETEVGYITESGEPIEYLMIGEARQWARI